MEQQQAAVLLSAVMDKLLGYALSRTENRQEAEDLAGDILLETLQSLHRLQDDAAFYGFFWSIANNQYKKWLRQKMKQAIPFEEGYLGCFWQTPEDEYVDKEEIQILRRELGLLSRQYRDTMVAYYIRGQSCAQIAASLSLSREMVKYYLFKARNQLKEGVCMTREYGEKSYNPATFRMDFWGNGDNRCFWALFKRKLPGNILLAAYDQPRTLQELSMELGVSAPYLEEELDILLQHEVLIFTGGKYQTNIVIFTSEMLNKLREEVQPLCDDMAERFSAMLKDRLDDFREFPVNSEKYDMNHQLWTMATLSTAYARTQAEYAIRERFGEYPTLCNGASGFVFGYDNDYENHYYNGIYGHCESPDQSAYFVVYNFRVLEDFQWWEPAHFEDSVRAMTDAILGRPADENNDMLIRLIQQKYVHSQNCSLSASFPVFRAKDLDNGCYELLKEPASALADLSHTISCQAEKLLKAAVPSLLSPKAAYLAHIKYNMDVPGMVVEAMVAKGILTVPTAGQKPAIFGAIR